VSNIEYLLKIDGYLTLVNVRQEVYEVFEVTKLTQLLHVHRGYG
jgi:hypothetical protein